MFLPLSYFHVICDDLNVFFPIVLPEPVAFYPLNAHFKATEKENMQPKGILGDVTITNGPYNEPGEAYMFYGTNSSYIEFPNDGRLDTRFSITLMCWVQPGGQDGPLFSYPSTPVDSSWEFHMSVVDGKLYNQIILEKRSMGSVSRSLSAIKTAEVLPVGKWVHVAASLDPNTGKHSLHINGNLRISQLIGKGLEIEATARKVRMGSRGDGNRNFKGKIAEMKVYNVALDEAQIRQTSIRQGS